MPTLGPSLAASDAERQSAVGRGVGDAGDRQRRRTRASRAELSSHPGVVVEIGAGRRRFLAMWGVMISLGFLLAVVFDLVAVLGLRLCE